MKKLMLCLVALAALVATPALRAQSAAPPAPGDLSGNWQGTLKAGKDLRIIFNIYKGEKDGWSAKMYSIDQTPHPFPVTSVIRQGSAVTISVDLLGGSFEGKLDASGKSIAGTWTQGGQPLPLTLLRATPETAWDIPTPPAAEKPMAADADPSFDVATIKPNPSGGSSLQGLGDGCQWIAGRSDHVCIQLAGEASCERTWMDGQRSIRHRCPARPTGHAESRAGAKHDEEAAGGPLRVEVSSR
jgi:hypothetical protein